MTFQDLLGDAVFAAAAALAVAAGVVAAIAVLGGLF